jgi:ribonuclease BN (tRNA processing enzyme)
MAFGGLDVRPIETVHYIPCWGFRVEADGRCLAYTADTGPDDVVGEIGDQADLLLAEATLRSLDEDAQPPEPRGHLLPAEAGTYAREAAARRLLLTHLPVNGDATWAATTAGEAFGGAVEIAAPQRSYEV